MLPGDVGNGCTPPLPPWSDESPIFLRSGEKLPNLVNDTRLNSLKLCAMGPFDTGKQDRDREGGDSG